MNQNNKFIGYLQHGTKQQPNRTDNSNRLPGAVVHLTGDSTVLQDSPSWVYKGEWNGTLNQNMFAEFRAGQFGYNFGLNSNTDGIRYEDLVTNEVTGGGRDWLNKRRRNQYTGALSYFKDNFAGGSHNFKFGGEYLDESGNILWNQQYTDDVVHYLSNGVPNSVRLGISGTSSQNALAQTSFFATDTWSIDRLTLNVGVRFDRYRVALPGQEIPVSRFNPVATPLAERSSVVAFNNFVPRFGATYDIMGDGKTVAKANWGRFYFNTGVTLADAVNPNTSQQYSDYNWNDLNGDRIFQEGETVGTPFTVFGGTSNVSIDPNLENAYTDEASFFLERTLLEDLGMRVGYVYKKDNNGWQQFNIARPFDVFNVPVTRPDPGPDNVAGNADDGPALNLFNLDDLSRGSNQNTQNIPGYEGTYKTFELSANKRYGNRWSMVASYSYTWTEEFGRNYFNNTTATAVSNFSFFGSFPTNPNERTFNEFTNWNAKFSGTMDAGWGLRVTPVWKIQSGAPYGRVVSANLNYNSAQLILVEPLGTRRQETVSVFDARVEKQLRFGAKARVGLFMDVYNLMNSNTAVNINWRAGAAFEKATTVLPPRIAKFGVRFNW
jgi:hypothetical protein